jgi:hypothetical protein
MIQDLSNDSSYNEILIKMINVFSPYILCQHFVGNELWYWNMLSKIPPGKNDINSTNNLSIIQDYDIVQCQLNFFYHFVENILPNINKKIILITSQFEYQILIRNDTTDFVLNHPNIVLWVSTNPIYEPSEKYMAFPCGLSPFNLSIYTNVLLHKEIVKERELAHMHLSETHECRKLLPKGDKYSEEEFYDNICKSKFMISPIGDREDCYRHYECIGLKTIPMSNIGDYLKYVFTNNMYYCDIDTMIESLRTNKVDFEYKEPDQNILSFEYHKDLLYKRIEKIRSSSSTST